MKLILNRGKLTSDGEGRFGNLYIWGTSFSCDTMERESMILQAGTFPIEFTISPEFSPHFDNQPMPLLGNTEPRTAIRIHWGSYAKDYKGCIGVGVVSGDMLISSKDTFKKLYEIIKNETDLEIQIVDEDESCAPNATGEDLEKKSSNVERNISFLEFVLQMLLNMISKK